MTPTLTNRPSGTMTGGRALAEMLRLSGAGPMFGMGGFQLLPFYDAVGLVDLNHNLINDERCGAFAADAYARVTNHAPAFATPPSAPAPPTWSPASSDR